MVSFDKVSLFTNIPLEECIDLAVKCISDGNPDIKLSNTELKSLFLCSHRSDPFLLVDISTRFGQVLYANESLLRNRKFDLISQSGWIITTQLRKL